MQGQWHGWKGESLRIMYLVLPFAVVVGLALLFGAIVMPQQKSLLADAGIRIFAVVFGVSMLWRAYCAFRLAPTFSRGDIFRMAAVNAIGGGLALFTEVSTVFPLIIVVWVWAVFIVWRRYDYFRS